MEKRITHTGQATWFVSTVPYSNLNQVLEVGSLVVPAFLVTRFRFEEMRNGFTDLDFTLRLRFNRKSDLVLVDGGTRITITSLP